MSKTNETTRQIIEFLLRNGIFAFRVNTTGIVDVKKGIFRHNPTTGIPDIVSILPPNGSFFGIEVKTGKDKLRDSQVSFHGNARNMGAEIIVVKDYDDFIKQWKNKLNKE